MIFMAPFASYPGDRTAQEFTHKFYGRSQRRIKGEQLESRPIQTWQHAYKPIGCRDFVGRVLFGGDIYSNPRDEVYLGRIGEFSKRWKPTVHYFCRNIHAMGQGIVSAGGAVSLFAASHHFLHKKAPEPAVYSFYKCIIRMVCYRLGFSSDLDPAISAIGSKPAELRGFTPGER